MNVAWLKERRWFRGKSHTTVDAAVEETFALDLAGEHVDLTIVRCRYEDGTSERYVLFARNGAVTNDALGDERMLGALLGKLKGGGTRAVGKHGVLVFRPLPGFEDERVDGAAPKPSSKEQTNTSVPFGDAFILKIVRKLDEGRSAELEMGEFLTRHGYTSAPEVLGAIEIERDGASEPATIGVVHRFLPNRGDAWATTLSLVRSHPSIDAYAPHARRLGERVAAMHAVLAQGTTPAFAPTRIDRAAREALAEAVRRQAAQVEAHLPPGTLARIDARIAGFVARAEDPVATRVHGDLHLGQILATEGDDYVIIDFEGEPARPLEERKAKRSPMADVAGMLRSFDYAAATAKLDRAWVRGIGDAFLAGYGAAPRDILDFYLLEKCIYEIGYEANNRPDWLPIPLRGLSELLS